MSTLKQKIQEIKALNSISGNIKNAILTHGIFTDKASINIRKLYDILDDELNRQGMGFNLSELNNFLEAYNISYTIVKPPKPNTEKKEITGAQIAKELIALQDLYNAFEIDFSKLTLEQSLSINKEIKHILNQYQQ